MKSLFIPLTTKYYEAFERGEKRHEMRLYGPRWNERTCAAGRDVVISKGYGKAHRLYGTVTEFRKVEWRHLSVSDRGALVECYGEKIVGSPIAYIHIGDLTKRGNHD